ncbi:MAG: hypothetical protein AAFV51_01545 [Pseudomonadota bacterium]
MSDTERDIIERYAASLIAGSNDGVSPFEYARSQGWLAETGEVTPAGKKAAAAFRDQDKTRSVFRIG